MYYNIFKPDMKQSSFNVILSLGFIFTENHSCFYVLVLQREVIVMDNNCLYIESLLYKSRPKINDNFFAKINVNNVTYYGFNS